MSLTPREKLLIMYRESNRGQRLKIASKLGFTGKPESKLRSLRRLLKTELTQTQKFNVTSYFKPYITKNNFETFWEGETPPFTLDGNFMIRGYGIGIFESPSVELREFYQPTGERNTFYSNDIETVFKLFQESINDLFEIQKTYEIFGLSFNERGFNGLIEEAEKEYNETFRALKLDGVGIFLVPSKARIITKEVNGKKKKISVPYTNARQFPKRKRKERENYINRAYGQLTKEGGRLNEFKSLD